MKPYEPLFDVLNKYFDGEESRELVKSLHSTDRFFNFPKFRETAEFCAAKMREAGLQEVEVLPLKADGKTVYGDWVIPQAWDAHSATLTLKEPLVENPVFADYESTPCSLVMYSAPTGTEGVVAEVVQVDDLDTLEQTDVKGKLVFTKLRHTEVARRAAELGAVGILSDFFPMYDGVRDTREQVYDASRWENAFLTPINDTGMFGFSLTPRNGDRLRKIIASQANAGQKVVMHAVVDTRLYDGEAFAITSVLYGEDPEGEEMMAFGHQCEPGAHDNASGCALLLELAFAYQRAIAAGALKRPKRNIRFGMGFECGGSMGYCHHHPDRVKRAIGGCVTDMVGTQEIDNTELCYWHDPLANWSYLDAGMFEINSAYMDYSGEKHPYVDKDFSIGTDNILGDPCFGMPTVAMITEPALSYHSSMDTPDRIDPAIMKRNGILAGTYLYTFANAGVEDAVRMIDVVKKDTERKIALLEQKDGAKAYLLQQCGADAIRSLARLTDDSSVLEQIESAAAAMNAIPEPACMKPTAEQLEKGGKLIPERLVMGCLNFDASSQLAALSRKEIEASEWSPAWNDRLNTPLFWSDGKRNLWEVCARSAAELGEEDVGAYFEEMLRFFTFLNQYGFIRFVK